MQKGEFDRALRKALMIFDKWNDVAGVFGNESSWRYEVESIIKDAINIGAKAALGLDYSQVGEEDEPTDSGDNKPCRFKRSCENYTNGCYCKSYVACA